VTAPRFDLVDVEAGVYVRSEFGELHLCAVDEDEDEAEALPPSAGRMKSRKGYEATARRSRGLAERGRSVALDSPWRAKKIAALQRSALRIGTETVGRFHIATFALGSFHDFKIPCFRRIPLPSPVFWNQ